ncbi:MAG: alpha-ketoglutarate-dependent dioxygenase AlkB [Ilumatobacteraceae bacterium]
MSAADDPLAHLLIDRRATVERRQLDDTSWVDVVAGFVRDPAVALAQVLAEVPFAQHEVLRYDRYVPERRLGGTVRPAANLLAGQIDLHLRAAYRQQFDGAVAILYRDGTDFQGLHSDREMKWLDDTLIGIVVLGVRRPFVLRPRGSWQQAAIDRVPAGAGPDDIVLMPGEGDLLVMGGRCQADWLHGVPAADADRPRVSLTWRWTSRRGRPDTAPGYFDGRQFSDRPRQRGIRRAPG